VKSAALAARRWIFCIFVPFAGAAFRVKLLCDNVTRLRAAAFDEASAGFDKKRTLD
jgi:hypothetical protein